MKKSYNDQDFTNVPGLVFTKHSDQPQSQMDPNTTHD